MTRDIMMALAVNAAVFSVLFALMLIARRLLAKRISAVMQYTLWALVIVKLVMPFGFESSFSLFSDFKTAEVSAAAADTQDIADILAELSDEGIHPLSSFEAQASGTQAQQAQTQSAAGSEAASAPAVISVPSLTWTEWAAIAWAAGAFVAGGAIALAALRLRRKVRRNMAEPSARVLDILEECKREMGIRRNVCAAIQPMLGVPMIMGLLCPVLLLPENIDRQSDKQLRHICLHELTHIKYGDTAVIVMLNTLCVVYWFNPLVWLCFAIIRKDMEAACDARVLRHIGTVARQDYIGTVLHFAGRESNAQLQAVMGMADGRTSMEQRIRGMFRQAKTGRKGRVVAAGIAVIMLAMSALSACQPTPEKEVVVGKDQAAMLSAAAQTPGAEGETIAEQVDAPESYTASVSAAEGKLTVTANSTPLIIPDTDSMPIVSVTAADFTQAQVDGLISALFEGKTLYEVQYGAETKGEISEEIVRWEQMKTTEEYSSEGDQAQIDEHIAMLKVKYEKAPETSKDIIVESDGQLKQTETADYETGEHIAYYMGLSATTDPDDYTKAQRMYVENNNDMTQSDVDVRTDENGKVTGMSARTVQRMATLRYENMSSAANSNYAQHPPIRVDESIVIDDAAVLAKLKTTPAQAKALVEQKLAAAGIDNIAVVAMYLTDDENLGNYDGLVSPAEHYVYELHLCRMVNGIPVSYIRGSTGSMGGMESAIDEAIKNGESVDDMDFSGISEWSYETINVMVSDDGIISLDWASPLNIGETLVQSAALMTFTEVAAKFEQQMQINWEARANMEGLEYMAFNVDHVSLEYQRIAEQDTLGGGLLVPVWNFYGTCTAPTSDGGDVGLSFLSGDNYYCNPMMSINAIDGSIIDVTQGY